MPSTPAKPPLEVRVTPKTPADAKRLTRAFEQLAQEGINMRAQLELNGRAAVIRAMSERPIEQLLDLLARTFRVEAVVSPPSFTYKHGISRPAEGEMKYANVISGHGQYAHVKLRVTPADDGTGVVVENRAIAGVIPSAFIPAVEEGIRDALSTGFDIGHWIEDVRVELIDGSFHEIDSSAAAFRAAASRALQDAIERAGPILLEPIMRLEVIVPPHHVDHVVADVVRRRGQVLSQNRDNERGVVRARVPLAELFGYEAVLAWHTQCEATCEIDFEGYAPAPADNPLQDDDRSSFVGAPRRPQLNPKESRAAVPEPEDD